MKAMLRVAAVVAALMLAGGTQAAAGNAMSASLEGTVVSVNTDPAAVATRCPAGFNAIVQTEGSGELTSGAYTGPVDYSSEHCVRFLVVTNHELAVIKLGAGVLTIVTPDGDELHAAYTQTGVLTGGVTGVSSNNGPFTITGGTEVFAGASGHGHVSANADGVIVTIEMNGSLRT
jgi:hypothetical protein